MPVADTVTGIALVELTAVGTAEASAARTLLDDVTGLLVDAFVPFDELVAADDDASLPPPPPHPATQSPSVTAMTHAIWRMLFPRFLLGST
jgi:hypothetical protein